MLIDGKRALAYIVSIGEIRPIPGYDRVEHARTFGWWVVVKKGEFHPGDKAVYFEVDSKVPKTDGRFSFLEEKHYKIKVQKMCKVFSQGLLMPLSEFPELNRKNLGDDVTDILGVTYSSKEDRRRKAGQSGDEKYKGMVQRYQHLAEKKWFKWLMKRTWGKKLLFAFLGKKEDKLKKFPDWIMKTDEERIENCPWMLENKESFVKTEKIDGTSATIFVNFTKKRPDFGVCSRNVRQMDAKQKNYHTDVSGLDNVYWEMAVKYDMENALKEIAGEHSIKKLVLQGEIYGASIQGNPYKMAEREFAAFNLIFDGKRLGSVEAANILKKHGIPFVPIIDENYILPDDLEEFKLSADGMSVVNPQCRREGFIYRTLDGVCSFKNVSRMYLLKKK